MMLHAAPMMILFLSVLLIGSARGGGAECLGLYTRCRCIAFREDKAQCDNPTGYQETSECIGASAGNFLIDSNDGEGRRFSETEPGVVCQETLDMCK